MRSSLRRTFGVVAFVVPSLVVACLSTAGRAAPSYVTVLAAERAQAAPTPGAEVDQRSPASAPQVIVRPSQQQPAAPSSSSSLAVDSSVSSGIAWMTLGLLILIGTVVISGRKR
ncbi:MAG: hypothetical protein HY329_06440 [Chloroflexi bacterium]|nr:hypothetical protein [Chloroflexota bacterium]